MKRGLNSSLLGLSLQYSLHFQSRLFQVTEPDSPGSHGSCAVNGLCVFRFFLLLPNLEITGISPHMLRWSLHFQGLDSD